jgi:hypothetical protein
MTVDEAIDRLLRDGRATRGVTARPQHPNYREAREFDFRECPCAQADARWQHPEFIARTSRGGHIYVGRDSRRNIVSIGRKGYHSSRYYGGICPALENAQ